MIPRKLSVDEISFGAHVDYSQNSEFIEQVHAQHIVSYSSTSWCCLCLSLDAGSRSWRAECYGPSPRCLAGSLQEPR